MVRPHRDDPKPMKTLGSATAASTAARAANGGVLRSCSISSRISRPVKPTLDDHLYACKPKPPPAKSEEELASERVSRAFIAATRSRGIRSGHRGS
ncbi:hypothetical protein PV326_008020 [Microctonus aethiopoides]|nr:hypothetical protein PV326_008020 [Microctonus aethiopoides]